MSEIKIEKVKLIKGGEKLLVQLKEDQEFADAGDMEASVSKTCNNPIHPDLRNAMNGLRCHLGILADYITHKQAANQEEIEKFVVIGYSIGGDEDDQGVVLTGQRKTKSGKMVTLNTPFLRFDVSDEDYYLISNLNECLKSIESEVLLYLQEGKCAPEPQQELPFISDLQQAEPVMKAQIDHPAEVYEGDTGETIQEEKPKRKRKQTASNPSGE